MSNYFDYPFQSVFDVAFPILSVVVFFYAFSNLESHGDVLVSVVLFVLNVGVLVFYGWGEVGGHAVDGAFCLGSSAFTNLLILGYKYDLVFKIFRRGNVTAKGVRRAEVICLGVAVASWFEMLGLVAAIVDFVKYGSNPGNDWSLGLGIDGLVLSAVSIYQALLEWFGEKRKENEQERDIELEGSDVPLV
jgi:hypothetical protein